MSTPDFKKEFNDRVLRPLLNAGKEKLDQVLDSVPSDLITQSVEDLYAQITNANVSASVDPAKLADAVDSLKAKLQDPQVSLQIAQALKGFLDKNSTEQLENIVSTLAGKVAPEQQYAVQGLFAQLSPALDLLRALSVEEVAAYIPMIANSLSSEDIAAQINNQLQQSAPQLAQQQQDLISKLPAPQTVADVVQELGKAVSDTLDNASKGATLAETLGVLKQFSANANAIVARVLGQDTPAQDNNPPAKKAPRKKGGGKHIDFK
jgi:hypothetical protein